MIISDLQHIESATETEVTGGSRYYYYKRPFNQAGAEASAEAFGKNTKAFTSTGTLVIEGQYSGSGSSSYSESF
jgi:predicted phage tail protein